MFTLLIVQRLLRLAMTIKTTIDLLCEVASLYTALRAKRRS